MSHDEHSQAVFGALGSADDERRHKSMAAVIRPIVRGVHSPDLLDPPLKPASPEDFVVLVQFFVGPADGDGEESFDVTIVGGAACTNLPEPAEALRGQLLELGQGRFYLDEYDHETVVAYFRDRIEGCSGKTWTEVARSIASFTRWEFDGYTE